MDFYRLNVQFCIPVSYTHLLREQWGKPDAYVGVIHRLDTGVSGLMVYAKTPQAAAALSLSLIHIFVEMNWKAIDAGVDAIHKVDVPASWSNPEADPAPKALSGRADLVKQIRDVMEPIARMDGDSLPVSSFVANANGEWEQGASAYEKRGTAVNVPEWDASKCVGCNQCAFVCSHATIRPFQLTADELAAAPAPVSYTHLDVYKGQRGYRAGDVRGLHP